MDDNEKILKNGAKANSMLKNMFFSKNIDNKLINQVYERIKEYKTNVKIETEKELSAISGRKYNYREAYRSQPYYVQIIKVKWLNHLPSTTFSQGVRYEIGLDMSFFTVKNYTDEFMVTLDKVFKKICKDVHICYGRRLWRI